MTNDASGGARADDGWIAAAPPAVLRAAPALAALGYPLLVWSGPAIWQPLLATAVLSPAVAVWALTRRSPTPSPVARATAFAAGAAPPAFTVTGAMLDFQRAVPLSGITVWIPLWLALAALAAWWVPADRNATASRRAADAEPGPLAPRAAGAPPALSPARTTHHAPRALAVAHGISALPIIVFALAHVTNQAAGVAGGAVHIAIMTSLRTVYRHPYVEPVLLACVAIQVITGIILVCRRTRPLARIDDLQRAAGVYLAVFFFSHINAVLRTRYLRGIDTDWHWVSALKFTDPWAARLAPYYGLAVVALAVHLACAVRGVAIGRGARPDRWTWLFALAVGLAALAATLALIGLSRG